MNIIRDVILLNVLTAFGGVFIGLSAHGMSLSKMLPLLGVSNIIFLIVGFFIIGCFTKENRFLHLKNVAIIVWLSSILNVFMFKEIKFGMWLLSIIPTFICMLIGGGISLLFVPDRINNNIGNTNNSTESFQTWVLSLASAVATEVIKQLAIIAVKSMG